MKRVPRVKQNKHLYSFNPFHKEQALKSAEVLSNRLWKEPEQQQTQGWAEGFLLSCLFIVLNTSQEYIFYSRHPLLLHHETIQNEPAIMKPSRQVTPLGFAVCLHDHVQRQAARQPEKNGFPYIQSNTLLWNGYKICLETNFKWEVEKHCTVLC